MGALFDLVTDLKDGLGEARVKYICKLPPPHAPRPAAAGGLVAFLDNEECPMVQLLAWWLVTQLVKVTPSLEGAWAAWLHANAGLVERMLFAPEQVCGKVWKGVERCGGGAQGCRRCGCMQTLAW